MDNDKRSTITYARQMRQEPTAPEAKLWQHLRARQLGGLKFRRQHPIGSYIVDFYCHEVRLVIEVDGESHVDQQQYDQKRTTWLNEQGVDVIRFWNHEVMENVDGVLSQILQVCEERRVEQNR